MASDGRPPLWTTLLVVIGTLGLVALALFVLADRTEVSDLGLDANETATASPQPSTTASPEPSPTVTPAPTSTAAPTTALSPTAPVPSLSVDGLNQTTVPGLAGRVGAVLAAAGWEVGRSDSAVLGSPSSTLYVPSGLEAAADVFTSQFPAVSRTRPAFEGLAVDGLTLVLAQPDAQALVASLESSAADLPAPVGPSP